MTIDGTKIHRMPTGKLEDMLEDAANAGNDRLYEAIEAELDARETDASDPAAVAVIQEAEELFSRVTFELGSYAA